CPAPRCTSWTNATIMARSSRSGPCPCCPATHRSCSPRACCAWSTRSTRPPSRRSRSRASRSTRMAARRTCTCPTWTTRRTSSTPSTMPRCARRSASPSPPDPTDCTHMPRALLSVSDKTGLTTFARALAAQGWEILSTGGTARALCEGGVNARDVADVTGFPEMLDGRVKTLHPAVHGGLLARRDLPEHMRALEEHGIEPIDLVAVNLYPFRE